MKSNHIVSLFVVAFLAVLLVPTSVSARCMAGSLSAFPKSGELPANRPMIMLRAYGNNRAAVRAIGDEELALVSKSDSDEVALEVVETLDSRASLTQVVLRPVEALEVGETYSLTVEYVRDKGRQIRILRDGKTTGSRSEKRTETWSWTVSQPDTSAPKLKGKIERGAATYARLGCGPRSYVEVEAKVSGVEDGEYLFLAKVKRKGQPDDVQRFYVTPSKEGKVTIGHGMCSGAFDLERGVSYELTLWAVDLAGNRSDASQVIQIDGPEPDGG